MENIKEILKNKQHNVNNVNKNINTNVNNVYKEKDKNVPNVRSSNTEFGKALDEFLSVYSDKPKATAQIISDELGDSEENFAFHLKVAMNNSPQLLYEALSITKSAAQAGIIRTTKPKYYVAVLKKKGAKW